MNMESLAATSSSDRLDSQAACKVDEGEDSVMRWRWWAVGAPANLYQRGQTTNLLVHLLWASLRTCSIVLWLSSSHLNGSTAKPAVSNYVSLLRHMSTTESFYRICHLRPICWSHGEIPQRCQNRSVLLMSRLVSDDNKNIHVSLDALMDLIFKNSSNTPAINS